MKNLMISAALAVALVSCGGKSDHEYPSAGEVEESVRLQMECYPQSTLQDIYKAHFQGHFGPGHIIKSRKSAYDYIVREVSQVDSISRSYPDYEPVGHDGTYVRVNLTVVADGRVSADLLTDALIDSNDSITLTVEEWAKEWAETCKIASRLYPNIPNFKNDSTEIAALLAAGKYAAHHSADFVNAYHPHYRLINTAIFKERILPLL